MRIAVIGTGYVGLVTGACLAKLGNEVVGVDENAAKIAQLKQGRIPIYEAGLQPLVDSELAAGTLSFSTDAPGAVSASEIIFITVGTPSGDNGEADMSAVQAVARMLAESINGYKVIVNKSTMPVGSTKMVQRIIEENLVTRHEFAVISNPEFLREGSAVEDFLHPDRVVVGSDDERAVGVMTDLYRPLNAPLIVTDPASAEMIKYASNAFLASKVSFINAIANICEAVGADVREVALGMGYDHRIGFEFLRAGPGFGGSCFPKDCRALIEIARCAGYDFGLLEGVLEVNEEQMELMVAKAKKYLGDIDGRRVAVLGLAFKANTDDLRESPALHIVGRLCEAGAAVTAYDPCCETVDILPQGVTLAKDPYAAVQGAELLMILTEWDEFKWLDFRKLRDSMASPIIVDTRNCLDPQVLRRLGFTYEGVGR
ncbi:MAG: UDP-glucose dehydrogenase family protein [Candidatus Geothermincolia bacterium]